MCLLLAEDNRGLAHWLEKALVQNGFVAGCVFDGLAVDHLLHNETYALAVLDISMPGLDGLEVIQRLRKRRQTLPVLPLTARSVAVDRVRGLNVGAGDYLAKLFETEELGARLQALLRRSAGQVHGIQQLGELVFHDGGYFLLQGQPLALTPREQALLTVLMYHRLRPVSRQQSFGQVFNLSDKISPESIELYIHRLRKKLQGSDVRIIALRDLGYVLERNDEVG